MQNRKRKKRISEIGKKVVNIKEAYTRFLKNDDDNSSLGLERLPSPYEIARFYGIKYKFVDLEGDVPSYINKHNFTIYISNRYRNNDYVARHLCAHELGHFFLHEKFVAEMNNSTDNEIEEYEANVFAILLMPQIMGGKKWESMEPKVLNTEVYEKIFKKGG